MVSYLYNENIKKRREDLLEGKQALKSKTLHLLKAINTKAKSFCGCGGR